MKEMLELKKEFEKESTDNVYLAPATCYLPIMHSYKYHLCAQTISLKRNETNTGETSANALQSLDVTAVLIGHDECKDTIEEKINKIKSVLQAKIKPFIILTDTKQDQDYQYTFQKLTGQIRAIFSQIPEKYYSELTFIYKPSWQKTEELSTDYLANLFYQCKEETKRDYKVTIPILFGGYIPEGKETEYYSNENIDGLLQEQTKRK